MANGYDMACEAMMKRQHKPRYESATTPAKPVREASGSARSDGKSSQERDGNNRYDISTPEKKRKALAAARRSDNPEDLRRLRGKIAESPLEPQRYPREALSSGDLNLGEAELTAKKRNALPKTAFAIPSERAYPIHDLAHARNALARVAQYGTPEEKRKVQAAVYRRYPQLRPDADENRPGRRIVRRDTPRRSDS